MAAQYADESAVESYTPWIDLANGRYLVTIEEAETPPHEAPGVCLRLEPMTADGHVADPLGTLVPWFDEDEA
ncbi:hypothetical protein ACFXQA_10305 [Microbacterium sp. P07]|uniref:hypothetical protein n=1 Tax=Microbacterium sp. P07 TaxID=3366952 RepID=UPI003744ED88